MLFRYNFKLFDTIREFLFCRGPLHAPLLTRTQHASQRDVAYVLPIHGHVDFELAGGTPGRHAGGIETIVIFL